MTGEEMKRTFSAKTVEAEELAILFAPQLSDHLPIIVDCRYQLADGNAGGCLGICRWTDGRRFLVALPLAWI